MAARIFLHSLHQALRSVALLLFPSVFIALFAWATAGSNSGNTSDPIRASSWIWLAAHAIPFRVNSLELSHSVSGTGALSFLPLGAIFLPYLATRSGFRRLIEMGLNSRGARIFFIFDYALLTMAISYFSRSHSLISEWKWAPLFGAGIALLGTANFAHPKLEFIKFPIYLFATLCGIFLLAFGTSLVSHFAIVKDLTTVVQAGWVGGGLFLMVQILYLPNVAIMALGYFFGLGFSIGQGTLISPTRFSLHEIPAISLLGGLPTGVAHPFRYGIFLEAAFALVFLSFIFFSHSTFGQRQRFALTTIFTFLSLFAAITFLSSGELITKALSPVGVSWWKVTTEMGIALIGAMVLVIYLPALATRVRKS